jgi:subtilisin family serine protease
MMKFSIVISAATVAFASQTMIPSVIAKVKEDVADVDQTIFKNDATDFEEYWSTFSDDPTDSVAHLMIKYTSDKGYNNLIAMASVTVVKEFPDDGYVAIQVDNENLATVMKALIDDTDIEAVEKDSLWVEQGVFESYLTEDEVRRSLRGGSDDNSHRSLTESIPYGITMTQANQVTYGSTKVTVCVVDTGVSISHPDLNSAKIAGTNRRSKIDNSVLNWNSDKRGHGTHIAGTIAAKMNNNIGVRGMGDIPLYIARGLNNVGQGRESDIREAIGQCESAGAKIISLSLAGGSITDSMKTVIDRVYANGGLIFAAAGNGGGKNIAFPAAHPKVIAVGAVTEAGTRWTGSNYGYNELMAPGNLVLSTTVNSQGQNIYAYYSGTSMATPHAAAAAALLWSNFPKCTNLQIRYALAYTAKDVGSSGCDTTYGYGIVQTKAAYNFLSNNPCTSANWGKTTSTNNQCSTIDVRPSTSRSRVSWVNWWS